MPRKTKKFINKKSAVTFHLVHRSQRDPLAADDEAPQHVLVPVRPNEVECDVIEETTRQREERICVQRTYGIGFDDDYDYMQHLREPDRQTAILIPKDPKRECTELFDGLNDESNTLVIAEKKIKPIILPSIALASKEEDDVGMLHRAIPPVGPQVEWDADVVAAMDVDFDYDSPQNALEDDFIYRATADCYLKEVNNDCENKNENQQETDDDSVHSSNLDDAFFDQYLEEETRSKFTQYSCSSSVLPRTDQLTLLDDQFEKFFETYDEDKIGDLAQYDIDGTSQQEALKLILGIKDVSDEVVQVVKPSVCQLQQQLHENRSTMYSNGHVETDDAYELVEDIVERQNEKWDCESIISTYSNIYNHPKLIEDEPNAMIKLSRKTGMPVDTVPTRKLTAKQLRALDRQNSVDSGRMQTVSETNNFTIAYANVRQRGESREEKSVRKQIVKEARKERRAEKKATKIAFKQERSRQNRELMNVHHHLKGIKIS